MFCPSQQDPTHCIVRGGGGDVDVSPKLAKKGDVVRVTLTSTPAYGGIADRTSQPTIGPVYKGVAPGLRLLECNGGKLAIDPSPAPNYTSVHMTGPRTCRYKVTKNGRGWQKASWHFSVRYGALASYSEDFLKAVGNNVTAIDGLVTGRPRNAGDKEGPGARGVKVVASGKGGRYSATTDRNGFYAIDIKKKGTYEVFPKARPSDLEQKPIPGFQPGQRKVKVHGDDVHDANFKLDRGDSIKVVFRSGNAEVSEAVANGASKLDGAIEVRDLNGDGIPSQDLSLSINQDSFSPRAALCATQLGGNPTRLWPGSSSDRVHVGQDPVHTDSNGNLPLSLYPGTEPGAFTITVRKKPPGPGDQPQTSTVQFKGLPAGDLATEMSIAMSGDPSAPTPANGHTPANDPGTANNENVAWLADAIAHGKLQGWTFDPLTAGGKYGLLFYKIGSPPGLDSNGVPNSGQVYNEGGGRGLQPIANGDPNAFQDLATWANGSDVRLATLGSAIVYLGFPLETGPASACLPWGY